MMSKETHGMADLPTQAGMDLGDLMLGLGKEAAADELGDAITAYSARYHAVRLGAEIAGNPQGEPVASEQLHQLEQAGETALAKEVQDVLDRGRELRQFLGVRRELFGTGAPVGGNVQISGDIVTFRRE